MNNREFQANLNNTPQAGAQSRPPRKAPRGMGIRSYALRRRGPKLLKVQLGIFYRRARIWFNNEFIGEVTGRKSLTEGQTFPLPDGATLSIKMQGSRLKLDRNGIPLPGTVDDPFLKVASASSLAGLIAVLTLSSLVAGLSNTRTTAPLSPLAQTIDIALIIAYAVLAVFIYNRRRWAIWTLVVLYGFDTVLLMLALLQGQTSILVNPVVIIVRLLFLRLIYIALPALDTLDAYEAIQASEKTEATSNLDVPPIISQPNRSVSSSSRPATTHPATMQSTFADFESLSHSPALDVQSTSIAVKLALPYDSDPKLVNAYRYVEKGNLHLARPLLLELLRTTPTNAYAWYLISFTTTTPSQQIESLKRAVRYNSTLIAAQERLTELLG